MADARCIGVFDSGVGGLSVLRPIHALLPAESLLYVADSAYLPYGDKPMEQVRARVLELAQALARRGAKALVVACNTATAAGIQELRGMLPLPVIGMEPGVKPAVTHSRNGVVGILATAGTLRSTRFAHLLARYGAGARVLMQPCPGLVAQVEKGALDSSDTEVLLRSYIAPLVNEGADTLVLGCTHYPFLLPLIRKVAGGHVHVVDTGPAVARQLQRQLAAHGLLNDAEGGGGVRFYTSGDPAAQQPLMERLWGAPLTVEPFPMETSAVEPQAILDFWFSDAARPRWFDATAAFDAQLRERFEGVWQAARRGDLDHWAATPQGALALVIVLDQFPLNMYRGQALGYSSEAQARTVAARAVDAGLDQALSGAEKSFLYLPFMHSEAPADQARSVALYEAAGLADGLKWARHHRDLIRRFGRFPHRNRALGRADTPEEAAYLASAAAFHG